MNDKDLRIAELEKALNPFVEHYRSIKGTFSEDAGWKFSEKIYCWPVRPLYKRDFLRAKAALSSSQTSGVLIDMPTMSKIQHLIGYAKSSLDVTPTVRTWFDRLCELAEGLDAVLEGKDE